MSANGELESHAAFALLELMVSPARMARLLDAMAGDRRGAVQLHKWGIAVSGAIHEALHVTELALRNAMDV
ncbi:MAG: hypothetical protein LBG60_09005 [Bifidobacteriaceae bacterium]|nr:hypothetical protein [Bifidobacteriaceae bacterium]